VEAAICERAFATFQKISDFYKLKAQKHYLEQSIKFQSNFYQYKSLW